MNAPPVVSRDVIDTFSQFVEAASGVLVPRVDSATIREFEALIQSAIPVVVEPARKLLCHIEQELASLRGFLIGDENDLLRIARLSYAEDAYTELMAWAMDPSVNRCAELAVQREWLASLGIGDSFEQPAKPCSQLRTANGVPDLVLLYEEFLVVVEAKTGSSEHGACGGEDQQTLAYPGAVRKTLNLPAAFPTYMVYLTPDRSEAANENAILASYLGFAICLSRALAELSEDLSAERQWPYRALLSHLATCAVPSDCEVRDVIRMCSLQSEDALDAAKLLAGVHHARVVWSLVE